MGRKGTGTGAKKEATVDSAEQEVNSEQNGVSACELMGHYKLDRCGLC